MTKTGAATTYRLACWQVRRRSCVVWLSSHWHTATDHCIAYHQWRQWRGSHWILMLRVVNMLVDPTKRWYGYSGCEDSVSYETAAVHLRPSLEAGSLW